MKKIKPKSRSNKEGLDNAINREGEGFTSVGRLVPVIVKNFAAPENDALEAQTYGRLIDKIRADNEPRLSVDDAKAMLPNSEQIVEKIMQGYDGKETRQRFEILKNPRSDDN